MKKLFSKSVYAVAFLSVYSGLTTAPLKSQETDKKVVASSTTATDEIELFEGMRTKSIDVKVIPLGSHGINIIFKNNTQSPVLVKLPKVFAAVPVLGQFGGGQFGGGQFGGGQFGGGGGLGGGGLGGGGGGLGGQGGGGQGLGGGFGGGAGGLGGGGLGGGGFGGGQLGGGQGGGGLGGGFFRVDTKRPAKMHVATVCLEYGKSDPNPRMKYMLAPLEQFNPNPMVAELCSLLADGKVKQNTAQAAAWNIANGISWEALAKKNRRESHIAGNERYFNASELRIAISLTGHCRAATEKLVTFASSTSPTEDRYREDR